MLSHKITYAVAGMIFAAAIAWTVAPAAVPLEPSAVAHLNTSTGLTGAGQPLALHGFDPVAYFTDGEPARGDARYSSTHDGATYRFASGEHQSAFDADPTRYLPEFGGFCAFGVTVSKKFDGDPRQWAIRDGKLYLNLNAEISELWRQDVPGNIEKARGQWDGIRNRAPAAL